MHATANNKTYTQTNVQVYVFSKWWGQIDKVRTFLLQLKPKILNWRELNPNKKITFDIFKTLIN